METRSHSLAVGSFVISLLLGALFFVLWFSRFEFVDDKRSYMIHFKGSVSGLRLNESVRFHGISVGAVKKIFIDPDNISAVKVKVSIDKPGLIREDSMASIEAQGLTGFSFVQIIGGAAESPVLKAKSGQKYPIIQSKPSNIEVLFSSGPVILDRINELTGRLNRLFSDRNIKVIGDTFENIADLSSQFSENSASFENLLKSTKKVVEKIDPLMIQTQQTFISFKESSDLIKNILKNSQKPLQSFTHDGLREVTQLAKELQKTSQKLQRILDQLDKAPLQFLKKNSSTGVPIP